MEKDSDGNYVENKVTKTKWKNKVTKTKWEKKVTETMQAYTNQP